MRAQSLSLFAAPWTVAHQAPLSMEFSRQEYWSGLPFPPPEHLPNPGTEPRSPALQADSLLPGLPEKCNILKREKQVSTVKQLRQLVPQPRV